MGCRPSKQAMSKVRAVDQRQHAHCLCSPRKASKKHKCNSTGTSSRRSSGNKNGSHKHSFSGGHRPCSSRNEVTDFPEFSTTTAVYRHSASKTSKITLRLSCDGSTLEIEQCDYDLEKTNKDCAIKSRPWSSAPNLTKLRDHKGRMFRDSCLLMKHSASGWSPSVRSTPSNTRGEPSRISALVNNPEDGLSPHCGGVHNQQESLQPGLNASLNKQHEARESTLSFSRLELEPTEEEPLIPKASEDCINPIDNTGSDFYRCDVSMVPNSKGIVTDKFRNGNCNDSSRGVDNAIDKLEFCCQSIRYVNRPKWLSNSTTEHGYSPYVLQVGQQSSTESNLSGYSSGFETIPVKIISSSIPTGRICMSGCTAKNPESTFFNSNDGFTDHVFKENRVPKHTYTTNTSRTKLHNKISTDIVSASCDCFAESAYTYSSLWENSRGIPINNINGHYHDAHRASAHTPTPIDSDAILDFTVLGCPVVTGSMASPSTPGSQTSSRGFYTPKHHVFCPEEDPVDASSTRNLSVMLRCNSYRIPSLDVSTQPNNNSRNKDGSSEVSSHINTSKEESENWNDMSQRVVKRSRSCKENICKEVGNTRRYYSNCEGDVSQSRSCAGNTKRDDSSSSSHSLWNSYSGREAIDEITYDIQGVLGCPGRNTCKNKSSSNNHSNNKNQDNSNAGNHGSYSCNNETSDVQNTCAAREIDNSSGVRIAAAYNLDAPKDSLEPDHASSRESASTSPTSSEQTRSSDNMTHYFLADSKFNVTDRAKVQRSSMLVIKKDPSALMSPMAEFQTYDMAIPHLKREKEWGPETLRFWTDSEEADMEALGGSDMCCSEDSSMEPMVRSAELNSEDSEDMEPTDGSGVCHCGELAMQAMKRPEMRNPENVEDQCLLYSSDISIMEPIDNSEAYNSDESDMETIGESDGWNSDEPGIDTMGDSKVPHYLSEGISDDGESGNRTERLWSHTRLQAPSDRLSLHGGRVASDHGNEMHASTTRNKEGDGAIAGNHHQLTETIAYWHRSSNEGAVQDNDTHSHDRTHTGSSYSHRDSLSSHLTDGIRENGRSSRVEAEQSRGPPSPLLMAKNKTSNPRSSNDELLKSIFDHDIKKGVDGAEYLVEILTPMRRHPDAGHVQPTQTQRDQTNVHHHSPPWSQSTDYLYEIMSETLLPEAVNSDNFVSDCSTPNSKTTPPVSATHPSLKPCVTNRNNPQSPQRYPYTPEDRRIVNACSDREISQENQLPKENASKTECNRVGERTETSTACSFVSSDQKIELDSKIEGFSCADGSQFPCGGGSITTHRKTSKSSPRISSSSEGSSPVTLTGNEEDKNVSLVRAKDQIVLQNLSTPETAIAECNVCRARASDDSALPVVENTRGDRPECVLSASIADANTSSNDPPFSPSFTTRKKYSTALFSPRAATSARNQNTAVGIERNGASIDGHTSGHEFSGEHSEQCHGLCAIDGPDRAHLNLDRILSPGLTTVSSLEQNLHIAMRQPGGTHGPNKTKDEEGRPSCVCRLNGMLLNAEKHQTNSAVGDTLGEASENVIRALHQVEICTKCTKGHAVVENGRELNGMIPKAVCIEHGCTQCPNSGDNRESAKRGDDLRAQTEEKMKIEQGQKIIALHGLVDAQTIRSTLMKTAFGAGSGVSPMNHHQFEISDRNLVSCFNPKESGKMTNTHHHYVANNIVSRQRASEDSPCEPVDTTTVEKDQRMVGSDDRLVWDGQNVGSGNSAKLECHASRDDTQQESRNIWFSANSELSNQNLHSTPLNVSANRHGASIDCSVLSKSDVASHKDSTPFAHSSTLGSGLNAAGPIIHRTTQPNHLSQAVIDPRVLERSNTAVNNCSRITSNNNHSSTNTNCCTSSILFRKHPTTGAATARQNSVLSLVRYFEKQQET